MKTKLITICFTLLVCLNAFADDEFSKTYSKTFDSNNETEIKLSNKYGSINITNWEKNQVIITVNITVDAKNQEQANSYFEQIKITLEEYENIIKGETDILKSFENVKFKIDYNVQMPKNLKLTLENKYGDVFINELTNYVDISVKYGSLRANKLTYGSDKPRSQIYLGYSKNSKIVEAGWLKIQLAYSTLSVEKSSALIILSKYSNFKADKTNSLVVESRYDTYKIGTTDKFIATEAKYSNYTFDKITNRIESDIKFSDLVVKEVPDNFYKIDVKVQYGKADLKISPQASYQLKGEAKYSDMDIPKSDNISMWRDHSSMRVQGRVGTDANTQSAVNISCEFGKIFLK